MSPFIPRPNLDLVDLLLGEHAALLTLLRHYEQRIPNFDLAQLHAAGETLRDMLMAHAIEEDHLLFQTLPVEERGVRETLDAMFGEHNEQRRMLDELAAIGSAAPARGQLGRTIELTREHFAVEERVLFGLARRVLDQDTLTRLGQEFARRRGLST